MTAVQNDRFRRIWLVLVLLAALMVLGRKSAAIAQCSPQQLANVTAVDGQQAEDFAASVAISGNTALIGAPFHTTAFTDDGAAYVFVQNGSSWTQQAKLVATDPAATDEFGTTVSVSGDTAVVGTPYNNNGLGANSGGVYVFVRGGTVWSFQAKLIPVDSVANQYLGSAVAISGDTIVAGAFGDGTAGTGAGAAYVFVRSGTTWSQQAKLIGSDLGTLDDFGGYSVAISADTAVIGADAKYDSTLNARVGAAYVFFRSGTSWAQQGKLVASDATANDRFLGFAVAVESDTAVVGGYQFNTPAGAEAGAAYVYTRSGSTWTQQAKLTASDGAAQDHFGYSVGISGDTALVGAPNDTNVAGSDSGSAYLYLRSGTAWSQQSKLIGNNTAAGDEFGIAVAVSGNLAAIGAWADDNTVGVDAGSAYVFSLGCTASCCAGDLTGDHVANVADISGFVAALLAGNACPPTCCPADMNSDQVVDGRDIRGFVGKVLAGGSCP